MDYMIIIKQARCRHDSKIRIWFGTGTGTGNPWPWHRHPFIHTSIHTPIHLSIDQPQPSLLKRPRTSCHLLIPYGPSRPRALPSPCIHPITQPPTRTRHPSTAPPPYVTLFCAPLTCRGPPLSHLSRSHSSTASYSFSPATLNASIPAHHPPGPVSFEQRPVCAPPPPQWIPNCRPSLASLTMS